MFPAQGGESQTTRNFLEGLALAVDLEGQPSVAPAASPGTKKARPMGCLEAQAPELEALAAVDFALSLANPYQHPDASMPGQETFEMVSGFTQDLETARKTLVSSDASRRYAVLGQNACRDLAADRAL